MGKFNPDKMWVELSRLKMFSFSTHLFSFSNVRSSYVTRFFIVLLQMLIITLKTDFIIFSYVLFSIFCWTFNDEHGSVRRFENEKILVTRENYVNKVISVLNIRPL